MTRNQLMQYAVQTGGNVDQVLDLFNEIDSAFGQEWCEGIVRPISFNELRGMVVGSVLHGKEWAAAQIAQYKEGPQTHVSDMPPPMPGRFLLAKPCKNCHQIIFLELEPQDMTTAGIRIAQKKLNQIFKDQKHED